jgi:hypothetical protein
VTFPFPVFCPGGSITSSYITTVTSTTDLTTYTFSAANLGTVLPGRVIIMGIHGRSVGGGAYSVSTVTVAGNSAVSQVSVSAANTTSLWTISDATNATGDIVVTFSAGSARAGVSIWNMYGSASTTATTTATDTTDVYTGTVDIPAGGAAFGIIRDESNTTTTWTNLTEDVDTTLETQVYSAAHADFSSAQTALALTADVAATTAGSGCFAVFSP